MTALADALRRAGCVFAEAEAAEVVRRLGADPERTAEVVAGRTAGIPLEYLLGVARFAGHDLHLSPGVFVPRRRAEALAAAAAEELGAGPAGVVVDLGCGTGAIAAALQHALPDWRVVATDVDPAAVACARENAAIHGFEVHEGSWLEALPADLVGRVDAVVGYLPHVPTPELDRIHPDLRRHESELAVAGGPDGLAGLVEVLDQLARWLAPRGWFRTLVAAEQLPAVRRELDRRTGWGVEVQLVDGDALVRVERSGTIEP